MKYLEQNKELIKMIGGYATQAVGPSIRSEIGVCNSRTKPTRELREGR